MKQRNGKIELMRFVFTVLVVAFHAGGDIWNGAKPLTEHLSLASQGAIGVEFFFLVSGFLMAKSVYRQNRQTPCDTQTLGSDTTRFLWRKVKGIWPYHLFFCFAIFVVHCIKVGSFHLHYLWYELPSLFFLHRSGIIGVVDAFIGVEWYISSMLLAMAVLYPLIRYNYNLFTHVVAPLTGILVIGYIAYTTDALTGAGEWVGLTFKTNLRAVAELCLGAAGYEVCRSMEGRTFTTLQRLMLTLAEAGGLLYAVYICCSRENTHMQFYALMALCVAVPLAFGGKGLLSGSSLFQNRVCMFLGAVSLPIYLCQNLTRAICKYWLGELPKRWQFIFVVVSTVLLGTAVYLIWNAIGSMRKKREKA